jgi:ribosomal protein S18 acetylase RimI-like enzyme
MMEIDRANRRDLRAILELQRLAYQSEAELYKDWSIPPLTETLEDLAAEFEHSVFLCARIGGQLAGSVRAQAHEGTCFIGRLIVRPSLWHQGIGRSLMHAIENCFSGVERFELFTGHLSDRNLRLYRRLGYRPVRETKISERITLMYLEKTLRFNNGTWAKNQKGPGIVHPPLNESRPP